MADAKKALEDFAFLTKEIAGNWAVLRQSISEHYQSASGLHFDISEETLTYRENTNEAVTREGIVFTRSGLPAADLIQLDKRFVEKDGIPSAEELLKRGLIKQNSSYFKKLVPSLKLPGFLLARLVELDKAKVERLTEEEFNKSGIIKRGEGENLVYLIKVFPGAELSPLINDLTETANPEIVPATTKTDESRTFFFLSDPDDQTFFGDSSIPDRKFSIDNLDLLQQQNAWASIWLSRNKNLVFEKKTNPDFIFRTPAVRFTNELTPSIVNREPWDVATLPTGGTASDTTLVSHLTHMLQLFQPGVREAVAGKHDRYELQIACRYAFSLAEGSGLNEDLLTTLPILLGLRLTPDQLPAYPAKLSKEISSWFKANLPVEENASLIFSVDVFSQLHKDVNASLPLLRVSHLELHLKNITNMPEIRTGNG